MFGLLKSDCPYKDRASLDLLNKDEMSDCDSVIIISPHEKRDSSTLNDQLGKCNIFCKFLSSLY